MQIIRMSLALVGLCSLWSNLSWAHDNFNDRFSPIFETRVKNEALIDRCAEVFARDARSNPATRILSSLALERLSQAICTNAEIAHTFLSQPYQWLAPLSLTERPLLLEIHDSKAQEIPAILAVLRQTLYNSRFARRYINGINMNLYPEPRALASGKINTLTINIDSWIKKHEKDSPGALLKWLDYISQTPDSFVAVVALAKYDRNHYKAEGHLDVVQFLDRFQTIYFGAHKEFCQRELQTRQ